MKTILTTFILFLSLSLHAQTGYEKAMVLQGMLNTCWIQYDSRTYGMKLSGPTTALYDKAISMAPENPRVISNRARWLMGSAQFFGKDIAPYCGEIDKAIELFEKEIATGFDPGWGKKAATDVKKQCEN